jgi:hypothetical protein
MGYDEDLHAAWSAVAAHRRNPHADPAHGVALDAAAEAARQQFHAYGGTAERADDIMESAFSGSVFKVRPRTQEFHSAKDRAVNG